jgi:hypothetical protein
MLNIRELCAEADAASIDARNIFRQAVRDKRDEMTLNRLVHEANVAHRRAIDLHNMKLGQRKMVLK